VVAVSAVRTGCGKSQIARYLSRELTAAGHRVAVVRHPMPYGDLARQSVQRFASLADMDAADCSLEEREEYEPHVAAGGIVFAGVDYAAVAAAAEREADVLLWDGGNNDFPFLLPDFHIVVVDALRPEQIDTHYPGGAVLRMADLVVINKALSADATTVRQLRERLIGLLPAVPVMAAGSPVTLSDPAAVRGRRVLVVEDGPTITHGGMPHGAGYAAVRDMADVTLINPRDCAVGEIAETFRQYPHIGPVLPALGYSVAQRKALQQTIEASGAEVVVTGTPIDLNRVVPLSIPVVRARYEYAEIAGQTPQEPGLAQRVLAALAGWTPGKAVAPA
jgi:predicted GTPase